MSISLSTIKNILTNNQLIRGRIHLSPEDIKKLYRSKIKQHQKIQNRLVHNQDIVASSLEQIKNLKSELKYCEETLQKAFHPSTKNISLLYKNLGHHCYIKARFYWQGKQREVQVGSIPIVLDIIQKMMDQGHLKGIVMPKTAQITWEKFKKNTKLIEATKEIATLKFQEYIIRKLSGNETHQLKRDNLEKRNNKKTKKTTHDQKYEVEHKEKEDFDWYVQWRNNNLK